MLDALRRYIAAIVFDANGESYPPLLLQLSLNIHAHLRPRGERDLSCSTSLLCAIQGLIQPQTVFDGHKYHRPSLFERRSCWKHRGKCFRICRREALQGMLLEDKNNAFTNVLCELELP